MKKMTQFLTAAIVVLLAVSFQLVFSQPTPPSGQTWQLVVSDDFNSFNTSTWGYGSTPWGSENQSSCTLIPASDTYVSGGSLVLRSRLGPFTGATGTSFKYSSGWAWLKTWRQYGYIEIRAQYPSHRGAWPAFWMLGDGWPPEIDVAEWRGAPKNYMTLAYYDGSWSTNTITGNYTGWHTYGLWWEAGSLRYYIDGVLRKTVTKSPSQTMYVILSNGTDCTDGDGTGFPNYFNIDYFRWYQLQGSNTGGGTYKIQNRGTSLFIDGMGRTANGSNAGQYASSSSTAQQWIIEAAGSYVKIKNVATGLYLDGMGRTTNGSNCGQYSGGSSNNQQWTREAAGTYFKFRNRATGLYIDGMGRTSNGSILGQYAGGSSNNQQWTLTQLKSASGNLAIIDEQDEISIHPTVLKSNFLTIEGLSGKSSVSFIDMQGRIVKKQKINESGSAQINVGLKKGIYLVKISTTSNTIVKRIIIE